MMSRLTLLTSLLTTSAQGGYYAVNTWLPTNQGFSHNAGRAVGALFPGLIGYLSQSMGLGTAIGVFTVIAYLLLLVALSMLPETHGRDLSVVPEPVRA